MDGFGTGMVDNVLNLVISGIPSIPKWNATTMDIENSFKPCYKWNTFNTVECNNIIEKYSKF